MLIKNSPHSPAQNMKQSLPKEPQQPYVSNVNQQQLTVMIFSKSPPSSSSWRECCQHEQQIAILQQKLMELHNKLIDQLDVCKEQELTIIDLTRKINDQNSRNAFDTFKYQSFGQHSDSKENQTPNHPHYHDSRDSYHAKAELLQADLEAMRAKVLTEITEKNRLKEEVKEIRSAHKKEVAVLTRKIEGLESQLARFREESEQRGERRRDCRTDQQLERVANRLGEMEARYLKERDTNRELTQQNIQLTEKLDELERELFRQRESRKAGRGFADSVSSVASSQAEHQFRMQATKLGRHSDYREEEILRDKEREREREKEQREKQRERERQKERERQRERAERTEEKRGKKRGFQETKELIKRLEQAEVNMRKNRKQPL